MLDQLKKRARQLKSETFALYLAARDPRTPWYTKLLVASIVAYALSPIDLIPDFIPVIGYVDDLFLLPLGIALAIKLIPSTILEECRMQAHSAFQNGKPVSWIAGAVVAIIWLVLTAFCAMWIFKVLARSP
ncbi:protein of unknown function DUF1232 [Marinobacterium lacunae]|uniref:DUF1232 domain-containing protein n=1 Tax=Marinobacterium lacunae TaxID=1232683 RepID=A0A081FWT4_9GAMM|nr:YkvA family protein [Marinobacterium lacunae]KEA62989.1 protein of unknown function DUF1232 [Marinobacterium lacunae]